MSSQSDPYARLLIMKRASRRDEFNEEEDVDPNLYGEDVPNAVHDEPLKILNNLNTLSCEPSVPVSPLPRIDLEPEDTIIKREQSPFQPVNNDNIPPGAMDDSENRLSLEGSSKGPKPRKRQRLIPEVLLYTWRDLQRRKQKDFEKIKKMNNPIVKKPKNIEFSLSSLCDRLKIAGLDPFEVTLEPVIRDQHVSRAFMSSVYGGGSQDTIPKIGPAKLAEHGMEHFMYVNASLHTHGPQWPGNPGLFFTGSLEDGVIDDQTYKTFVRLDAAKWMYVGDYILFRVPPLSKEEWNFMSTTVRNAWVSYLMRKSWGSLIRARVVARRELGRKPTVAEWQRVCDEGRSSLITPPEVHAALEAGHEQLGIYGMKCVGYDEAFQRQLVERFTRWVPPAPKPRGERRGRQGENILKLEDPESKPKIKQEVKTEPKSGTMLKLKKRKRQPTSESDAELFRESDYEEDLERYRKLVRQSIASIGMKKYEYKDLFGPSDYEDFGDGDWRPDIKMSDNASQPQPQISKQQRNSGI